MLKKFIIALVIALALPATAFAHSALVSSMPQAGSTEVTFPPEIVLTFNEPLLTLENGSANSITLSSPSGQEIALRATVIKGNEISAQVLPEPRENGEYTVSYRVVSQDGHPIEGRFTFAVGGNDQVTSSPTTTPVGNGDVIQENGETGKALVVFFILAVIALIAYRTFVGRK